MTTASSQSCEAMSVLVVLRDCFLKLFEETEQYREQTLRIDNKLEECKSILQELHRSHMNQTQMLETSPPTRSSAPLPETTLGTREASDSPATKTESPRSGSGIRPETMISPGTWEQEVEATLAETEELLLRASKSRIRPPNLECLEQESSTNGTAALCSRSPEWSQGNSRRDPQQGGRHLTEEEAELEKWQMQVKEHPSLPTSHDTPTASHLPRPPPTTPTANVNNTSTTGGNPNLIPSASSSSSAPPPPPVPPAPKGILKHTDARNNNTASAADSPQEPIEDEVARLLSEGVWKQKQDKRTGRPYYYLVADKTRVVWSLHKEVARMREASGGL